MFKFKKVKIDEEKLNNTVNYELYRKYYNQISNVKAFGESNYCILESDFKMERVIQKAVLKEVKRRLENQGYKVSKVRPKLSCYWIKVTWE